MSDQRPAAGDTPRDPPVTGKEIFGWAMFDFANSSYTTVIVTVVYAVVFPKIIVGDAPDFRLGNMLWSLALSISYGLVVLTVPILGAIMDYSAAKKRYLFFSYLLTVVATIALYFATPGSVALAILLVVVSNYGFSVGESFAASFLPELGPPEKLGRISGFAWGLGYIGGLMSTAIVIFGLGPQTAANFGHMRLVGPVTGVFFMLAAIPTFLLLKERGKAKSLPPSKTVLHIGFGRLRETLRHLPKYRDLSIFFVAFFFVMAGLSIVISFAFIYGDQVIKWSPLTQTLMFVITQITAAGGALAFGWLQSKLGDKRTFNLTLFIWIATVLLIYGTNSIARALGMKAEHVFLVVGCFAGLCLGATQSASRTLVALFSPPDKTGEFFGFWGVFAKLASIFGLLSLGFLQASLGLSTAILVCAVFFFLAFVVTLFVNEARGRAAARPES